MSFYSVKGDCAIVKVKVNTGARENKINGEKNDELLIQLKAQPEKDKANKELTVFLAKYFDISRADVDIRSGSHSHHKIIGLPGSVERRLKAIMQEKS